LRRASEGTIATLRSDLEIKTKSELELATQLGDLRARLEGSESQAAETSKNLTTELEAARAERLGIQQRLSDRLGEREQMLAQKDQTLAELMRELQAAREERDTVTQRLGERLRDRETTIAALEKSFADMRIEKVQVEERLRVLNEERARIERSLAMDDLPTGPAKPAANVSVLQEAPMPPEEESIPVADSDESALG